MKKTIVYVDGGNLYFGLIRRMGVKWLDLMALSRKLLNGEHEIVGIVYFASRVIDKSSDHHKSSRQDKYFDALRNRKFVEIVEGRYREQKEKSLPASDGCVTCDKLLPDGRIRVFRITEKLTDVNIAVRMLSDAYEHKADSFVLISGDSDLSPVVRTIRYQIGMPVIVFNPQMSVCNDLRQYATFYRNIDPSLGSECWLPDSFEAMDGSGRVIHCPEAWRRETEVRR